MASAAFQFIIFDGRDRRELDFSILSEGHRASHETVQEHGTLRLSIRPKDTEQVKRLCQSTERYVELCTLAIYVQGRTTIQGYCLLDSGLNAIAVRGDIPAGRSCTRNSHRGG